LVYLQTIRHPFFNKGLNVEGEQIAFDRILSENEPAGQECPAYRFPEIAAFIPTRRGILQHSRELLSVGFYQDG